MNQKVLIEQLKKGEEQSYVYLYDMYGKKLLQLAHKMMGDIGEAEDVVQITFTKVYLKINGFEGRSDIFTWLYSIALNECRRKLSNNKKNTVYDLEMLIKSVESKESKKQFEQFEEEFYIEQVKDGCLLGLLRCLAFHQRIAFILNVLLKIEVFKVAKIIDKSENATRILISRAKKNIKSFLCKNCSLYNKKNTCRCENLINISLKKGWIKRFENHNKAKPYPIKINIIKDEINDLEKITLLYETIQAHESDQIISKLKKMMKEKQFQIFNAQKVK
ncbi:MAG: RNA polymerase sigma factor [Clostridiales bacterium]|nr:RNA polymerase sigma factor [Clostridiales bacterium]